MQITKRRFTLSGILLLKALAVVFWGISSVWTTGLAIMFVSDVWLLWQILHARAQGLGPVYSRFATTRLEVWVTIDDGPDPVDTPKILELLARHQAHATFFLIGEKVEKYPELVARIAAAGHEVGHHTQTHPVAGFWCAGPGKVAREIDDGLASLARQNVRPTRFRAPAGLKSPFLHPVLTRTGLDCCAWSHRALERSSRTVAEATERVLRNLAPGSVILLHEGPAIPPAFRVHVIEQVLIGLRDRGLRAIVPRPEALRA